jgi:hypothetical protein
VLSFGVSSIPFCVQHCFSPVLYALLRFSKYSLNILLKDDDVCKGPFSKIRCVVISCVACAVLLA